MQSGRWPVEVVVYTPPPPPPSRHTSPLSLCCDPHRPHYDGEGTLRHKVMASLAVELTPIKGTLTHVSRAFAGFETLRHIQNETEGGYFTMPSLG